MTKRFNLIIISSSWGELDWILPYIYYRKKNYDENLISYMAKELNKIPHIMCEKPNGAFYVFPGFEYYLNKTTANDKIIQTSSDLSLYILDQTGVVTVAGDSFGAPNNIRLSYATSDAIIIEACKRIKSALGKL